MRIGNFRNKDGFIVVFDITNENSLDELESYMTDIGLENDTGFVNCILVGNKCDLEKLRKVKIEDAKKFAEKYEMSYIETSAKKRINIDETFIYLVQKIRLYRKEGNVKTILNEKNKKIQEKKIKEEKKIIDKSKNDKNIVSPRKNLKKKSLFKRHPLVPSLFMRLFKKSKRNSFISNLKK